jgi:exonuclease III
MHVIKIATLNINGITAPTRVGMLSDFIKRHEIDTLFLQEVTSMDVLKFRVMKPTTTLGSR